MLWGVFTTGILIGLGLFDVIHFIKKRKKNRKTGFPVTRRKYR